MTYTKLVVFGDYLVAKPTSWLDNLAARFQFQPCSYAEDLAVTLPKTKNQPAIRNEVETFLADPTQRARTEETTFLFSCGTSDGFAGETDQEAVLREIRPLVSMLQKAGGKAFLICTTFAMTRTPFGYAEEAEDRLFRLSHYSCMLAHGLRNLVAELRKEGLEVECVDLYDLFADIMAYPDKYGLKRDSLQELEWLEEGENALFTGKKRPKPTKRAEGIILEHATESMQRLIHPKAAKLKNVAEFDGARL